MKFYLVLLFSFFAVIQFYGCDNGASSSDEPDTMPLVGELDSSNTGTNIDVASADLDSLLSTLFSSFNFGGGIDFFYDIKNRMKTRDTTTSWDTVINIDSMVDGKSGTIDYSGSGVFSSFSKTEGTETIEYDSSDIETREVYYNYSSDSILFFGGESICKELEKDTFTDVGEAQHSQNEETKVCSLNLRFNGKYKGNIAGSFKYHYHETDVDLIDSTVTASFVLTSASSKVDSIKLDENDLADYLE